MFETCYRPRSSGHKNSPHGQWSRHHLDTPADVFCPERTSGLLLKQLHHHWLRYIYPTQIYGPQTLEFKSPDITINSKGYCGTLRILHTAINRKYPGMLIIGVCIITPIPMWPTLSRRCCILCTTGCFTISYTVQTFHCVTSTCSAPLSKVLRCCIFR